MRSKVAIWLEQQWYQIGPWHILLWPISLIFSGLVWIRRVFYRVGIFKSYGLPVPLVVVGNITVGGAGKTPLVILLAKHLRQLGYHPGVISRGYGAVISTAKPVEQNSTAQEVGDEPLLIARQSECPVWVGRDRVLTAQSLLRAHPNCNILISDDGLQHYRMRRDVELVVVDGVRRFGNKLSLPAGPLREPMLRLSQVDAIVYNGGDGASNYQMRLRGVRLMNVQDPSIAISPAELTGRPLHAIAGIGHPDRFFEQLKQLGMDVQKHPFPDHHHYSLEDLQFAGDDTILMTEKDAVKCTAFARSNWWYLPVEAEVDTELLDLVSLKIRQKAGNSYG